MTEHHILNLGAGVQSTCLYLMAADGLLPQIQCAIFADTQEEPESVYAHLQWLQSLGGPRIDIVTAGRLGDNLLTGRNSTGHRFASIPAFTAAEGASTGIMLRQCSMEYKVEPITRHIRRNIVGLAPGRPLPKGVEDTQYIGISLDEAGRAQRILKNSTKRGWKVRFPLIEMNWTRKQCLEYLESRVPHPVPRSACVFCPYHSDNEWAHLKQNDPVGWARAVEIDEALRIPGNVVNRGMEAKMYLHRSLKPLDLVQLDPKPVKYRAIQMQLLQGECLGVCGV